MANWQLTQIHQSMNLKGFYYSVITGHPFPPEFENDNVTQFKYVLHM